MSKVLQLIDYEHLMDFEQYVRIEHMIEKDMKEARDEWNAIDGFKSYVNPDDDIPFQGESMLKREEAIEILKDIIEELKDYQSFTLSKKAKEVIDYLES